MDVMKALMRVCVLAGDNRCPFIFFTDGSMALSANERWGSAGSRRLLFSRDGMAQCEHACPFAQMGRAAQLTVNRHLR
jgi:hypothetical protein